MTAYAYLLLAILFEVFGTTCMKLAEGFTRLVPSVLIFVFYGCSFTALTLCLKQIDVSIAYAIWSGLGTMLIAIIGVVFFNEPLSILKVVSILLIIVGVIGVNVSNPSP
jgi:small multidrug resistance pump